LPEDLCVERLIEAKLRDPAAIAKVDEHRAAMVARALDPTGQNDGLADVFGAKLATAVSAGVLGQERAHLKSLQKTPTLA